MARSGAGGIDATLKERENDPLEKQLNEANQRNGELVMEAQALHGRIFRSLEELRADVAEFAERYNRHSRREKLGFMSPLEACQVSAMREAA